LIIIAVFSLLFTGCEDKIDPIVEQLQFERVFSPLNLTVRIRNKTTAEITWSQKDDAESYVVEFSEDSLQFSSIVKTLNVAPNEIPISVPLDGQTLYSVRVKGVSSAGMEDSKWTAAAFRTEAENIFYPVNPSDVGATSTTLKWPAGSEVTHFIIDPGNVNRPVKPEEIAAGIATITGLTGETTYNVKLMKETKQRGETSFTTLLDIGDAIAVYPEDDLNAAVAAAEPGDVLVLFPGNYLVYTGSVVINKSISIKGFYPHNKPVVHVGFVLEDGVKEVEIRDLEMDGKYFNSETNADDMLSYVFQHNTTGVEYGSLTVSGCNIYDYKKSIFSGASGIVSTIASISMDNCVVTNVLTDAADCIDFRGGYVASLSLTNSTFSNCAPARDFIRLDDTSGTYPGLVSNVLIDHCTLYKVSNVDSRRILYVRFVENTLKVTNTIIAETMGYYTNQSRSAQPECSNNNYFNAPGFMPDGSAVSGAKFDISGNFTQLDPGFVNAANGDFTVTNQTIIDNNVGDPRW
ncbi:MAG: DUF4957 domain-containing protein, partial [Bacteroidetes bacterium]